MDDLIISSEDEIQSIEKLKLGEIESNSFNQLKNILDSEPVLSIYNPKIETEIQ